MYRVALRPNTAGNTRKAARVKLRAFHPDKDESCSWLSPTSIIRN